MSVTTTRLGMKKKAWKVMELEPVTKLKHLSDCFGNYEIMSPN